MKPSLSTRAGALFVFMMVMSTNAAADAIIKFDLSPSSPAGPDMVYAGGVFSTTNDGNSSTTGFQDTVLLFTGPLSFLTPILSGASFSLGGVTASGLAIVTSGVITQLTTSGTFDLYAADNSLLLSGALNSGVLSGGIASSTGSFFNSTAATFTGGSLLAYLAPTPAGISIALSNILNDSGSIGMAIADGCTGQCQLRDFNASADGLMDGKAVPEPVTALLLTTGLMSAFFVRRRQA